MLFLYFAKKEPHPEMICCQVLDIVNPDTKPDITDIKKQISLLKNLVNKN